MAKEFDNYLAYSETIRIISNKRYLKDLLKPISVYYKPTQTQCILELLQLQEDNTDLFMEYSGANKQ